MSRSTTPAPPIAVDVAVVLTAIVRLEPDAGGYSASIPALPGCHTDTAGISSGHARITAGRALPAALFRLSEGARSRAG